MQRNTSSTYPLIVLSLLFLSVSASSQAKLSLKDALDAAIEKQKNQYQSAEIPNIEKADFISWLDGSPFVSVSALRSQNDFGTDETEVGLTLPIKSRVRRAIEKKLQVNATLLKDNATRQQALYLSGQIRELVWGAQMLRVNMNTAEKKIDMLNGLNSTVHALAESRAVPEYIALLLEKESIDAALALLEYEYQLSSTLSEFTRLTGLSEFPSNVEEKFESASFFSILNHPDIALLDGAWEYFARSLEAANKRTEPWHVTLTARRVEVPTFDENQIGLGVEIPLSMGNQYSSLQRSDYIKGLAEYQLAKQALASKLMSLFEQARRDVDYLSARQALLNNADEPVAKLEQIIPTLLNANLENKESVIRSALEVIDARGNIELNRVAMQKQISMLKQAAGISI